MSLLLSSNLEAGRVRVRVRSEVSCQELTGKIFVLTDRSLADKRRSNLRPPL
jgi:hypothetical protein